MSGSMNEKPEAVERYGPCDHPMIEERSDGGWYCTECGQRRS